MTSTGSVFVVKWQKFAAKEEKKCACNYRQGFYFLLQFCDFQSVAIFSHFLNKCFEFKTTNTKFPRLVHKSQKKKPGKFWKFSFLWFKLLVSIFFSCSLAG
jgi:hypothetical protein